MDGVECGVGVGEEWRLGTAFFCVFLMKFRNRVAAWVFFRGGAGLGFLGA